MRADNKLSNCMCIDCQLMYSHQHFQSVQDKGHQFRQKILHKGHSFELVEILALHLVHFRPHTVRGVKRTVQYNYLYTNTDSCPYKVRNAPCAELCRHDQPQLMQLIKYTKHCKTQHTISKVTNKQNIEMHRHQNNHSKVYNNTICVRLYVCLQ